METKVGTGGSSISDVAIQEDGKIVAGGNSDGPIGSKFTIVRYNTNGSLDQSFGEGGVVTTVFTQNHGICNKIFIAEEKKDKIIATGCTSDVTTGVGDFVTAGYNFDGSPDPEFGSGGIQITDLDMHDYSYSADCKLTGKLFSSAIRFQLKVLSNIAPLPATMATRRRHLLLSASADGYKTTH